MAAEPPGDRKGCAGGEFAGGFGGAEGGDGDAGDAGDQPDVWGDVDSRG
jgi:hypothetical protein